MTTTESRDIYDVISGENNTDRQIDRQTDRQTGRQAGIRPS